MNSATVNWNSSGKNSLLEISSGGELNILSGNFVDTSGTAASELIEADTGHQIVVKGNGSKLICPASISGNNKLGTIIGSTYGGNTMEVSNYGEVKAPYRFAIGYSSMAHRNRATFREHAKYALSDLRVGDFGSCSNRLEILDGANGTFSTGHVGGMERTSHDNHFILSNATLQCRQVFVSRVDGSESNTFEIVGADTSFGVTVTDLPRYPFVYAGAHNRFTLDGATWNYWLNMEFEHGSSSNVIEFINGANMTANGGYYTGTNSVKSCGNRIYVGSGATMCGAFYNFTCADNVMIVSNATVQAAMTDDGKQGTMDFGVKVANVEASTIANNGLVLRGATPRVQAGGNIAFQRDSFLQFDVPLTGYGAEYKPIICNKLTLDSTSRLKLTGIAELQATLAKSTAYTLVSTSNGVTIPDEVLTAANAELAAARASLTLANDNTELVLHVAGPHAGLMVIIR